MIKFLHVFFALLFIIDSHAFAVSKPPIIHHQTGFIENKGQVCDQFGNPRPDVKFIYTANGFKLILRTNGWSYEFVQPIHSSSMRKQKESEFTDYNDRHDEVSFNSSRTDVTLVNARSNPEIISEEGFADVKNYYTAFTGLNGVTNVHHYRTIIYRNIYPNIDLTFTLEGNSDFHIKYSFIIHPGGDLRDIQMILDGASSISNGINGSLQVVTSLGMIEDAAPVYFVGENTEKIPGGFLRDGNEISFQSINYDYSQKLIIDPEITYSTYYGGDGTDFSEDLTFDKAGNIIVVGRTTSLSGIATSGAWLTTYAGGNYDAFLLKFSSSFQLQWATYVGGAKVDYGWGVSTDSKNRIYLGGETYSNGLATPGVAQKIVNGQESDGWISRFTPSGTLMWSRYLGGGDKDQVLGIHNDLQDRVIITGYTLSSDSISGPGSIQPIYGGKGGGFLAKLDTANGNAIWSTYYGGTRDDRGHHITVDKSNNILLTGTCLSVTNIATSGSFQPVHAEELDAYLAKFTPAGIVIWGTYYGGNHDDRGRECEVDQQSNIYMTGFTVSTNNIATPPCFKETFTPGVDSTGYNTSDAYIVKFDSAGHRLWGTYFGDTLSEIARGLSLNSNSDVFIAGTTFSDKNIAFGNAFQTNLGGVSDLFFAKFNRDGALQWSSYFGGSNDEVTDGYAQVIRVDALNRIYLTGASLSADSISTPGAYKTTLSSNAYDVYIARFDDKCFDRYEKNNAFGKAKQLTATFDTTSWGYYAKIDNGADKDFFYFNVPPGAASLEVRLFELPANYNITLYDSLKNEIASSKKTGLKAEKITINNPVSGKYYLRITGKNSTTFNDSLCYRFTVFLYNHPLKEYYQPPLNVSAFEIYPNPASSSVIFSIEAEEREDAMMTLVNVLGEEVYHEVYSLQKGKNTIQESIASLPNGFYEVILEMHGRQESAKLMVHH